MKKLKDSIFFKKTQQGERDAENQIMKQRAKFVADSIANEISKSMNK